MRLVAKPGLTFFKLFWHNLAVARISDLLLPSPCQAWAYFLKTKLDSLPSLGFHLLKTKSGIWFQLLRPHTWPEVASFSRSACRSSKLEYHLEYSHYYLVTTIPTVGSGGNSRRDIQTPPSRHESQLDTPANHLSPRMASCSFSDCYLSN